MKNEILIEQFSYYTFFSAKEVETKDYHLTEHNFLETKMLYVNEIVSFQKFFQDKSELLQILADNYGLIKTVGSDFHDESHTFGYEQNIEWLAEFQDAISKRNQEYDESKVIKLATELDMKMLLGKSQIWLKNIMK